MNAGTNGVPMVPSYPGLLSAPKKLGIHVALCRQTCEVTVARGSSLRALGCHKVLKTVGFKRQGDILVWTGRGGNDGAVRGVRQEACCEVAHE